MKPFQNIIVLFILTVINFNIASASFEVEDKTEVLRLEPGVKKVIVVPKKYDFSSERAEFTQFRARYSTFWAIFFLTAFVMPYVW